MKSFVFYISKIVNKNVEKEHFVSIYFWLCNSYGGTKPSSLTFNLACAVGNIKINIIY